MTKKSVIVSAGNEIYLFAVQRKIEEEKRLSHAPDVVAIDFKSVSAPEDLIILKAKITSELADRDFVKVVVNAHGSEGQLDLGKEIHPMELSQETREGKKLLLEIFTCGAGKGIGKAAESDDMRLTRNSLLYQNLPRNNNLIIHAGHFSTLASMSVEQIERTYKETDEVRLFLDGIINSPETIKFLTRKDDVIKIHKHSAPKPKSAEDLTDEKIREFLQQEIENFLDFYSAEVSEIPAEDRKEISQEYQAKLTPELILKYKEEAFILELDRAAKLPVFSGHKPYCGFYLDAGVNPNCCLSDGNTALIFAVDANHPELVEELLRRGGNPNQKNERGITALGHAIFHNKSNALDALLKNSKTDLSQTGSEGEPISHAALFYGKKDALHAMLKAGADINQKDENGDTLLHQVVKAVPRDLKMLEYLLENGANPNLSNVSFTPVAKILNDVLAAKKLLNDADSEAILLLKKYGADIDVTMLLGMTPLQASCSFGRGDLVDFLLQSGAKIDLESGEKKFTALQVACAKEEPEIVAKLLAAGADPDKKNAEGKSALMIARETGRVDMLTALVEAKRKPSKVLRGSVTASAVVGGERERVD